MADKHNGQTDSLLLGILSRFSESAKSNVTRIAINDFISMAKETLSELREVDTLLTQISKEIGGLSKSDLKKLGSDAFDTASKYGKSASDYLTEFQEASRAGYQNAA